MTFRAEAICKPKHNTLAYARAPETGFVVFDINPSLERFLDPETVKTVCASMGWEVVPTYFNGTFGGDLKKFVDEALQRDSFLGGPKIEGIVVKNYFRFGKDHHVLMGKYVSEAFKEKHRKEWSVGIPFDSLIAGEYRNDARWNKAVQHLRDDGKLTDSVKDIGPLIAEIKRDILEEGEEEIKKRLFAHFWKDIARRVVAGFPEYYKTLLLKQQSVPLGDSASAAMPLPGESQNSSST